MLSYVCPIPFWDGNSNDQRTKVPKSRKSDRNLIKLRTHTHTHPCFISRSLSPNKDMFLDFIFSNDKLVYSVLFNNSFSEIKMSFFN